jgi:mRNA interferase RelE/StbE
VATYKILIKPSAVKELNKIPKRDLPKITVKIEALSEIPRPQGCEKFAVQNSYRIRQGSRDIHGSQLY